jgi:hypothetical protein
LPPVKAGYRPPIPPYRWEGGSVVPLDDFMERDGFSVDDFYPIAQSWNMLDGVFYSFPTNMHLCHAD